MAKTIKFEKGSDATKTFQQLKAEQEALNVRVRDAAVDALKEFCANVFAENPEVEQFSWVQYGGEYNDEGPYHGVNRIAINDEDVGEAIYDYGQGGTAGAIHTSLLEVFGENILMDALGTDLHSCDLVTVTRSGLTVEYWEQW